MIQDYDPRWPLRFEELRFGIAAALGEIASAIEHVGSTAVPGLAAKPIIDMDVLLTSSSALSAAVSRLSSLGYRHQGDLGIPAKPSRRRPESSLIIFMCACRTALNTAATWCSGITCETIRMTPRPTPR